MGANARSTLSTEPVIQFMTEEEIAKKSRIEAFRLWETMCSCRKLPHLAIWNMREAEPICLIGGFLVVLMSRELQDAILKHVRIDALSGLAMEYGAVLQMTVDDAAYEMAKASPPIPLVDPFPNLTDNGDWMKNTKWSMK